MYANSMRARVTFLAGHVNRNGIEKSTLTFTGGKKLLHDWIIDYSYFRYFVNEQCDRYAGER
jgi:hypothetical protein